MRLAKTIPVLLAIVVMVAGGLSGATLGQGNPRIELKDVSETQALSLAEPAGLFHLTRGLPPRFILRSASNIQRLDLAWPDTLVQASVLEQERIIFKGVSSVQNLSLEQVPDALLEASRQVGPRFIFRGVSDIKELGIDGEPLYTSGLLARPTPTPTPTPRPKPTPTATPKPAPTRVAATATPALVPTPTPTPTPLPGQEGVSPNLHMDRTRGVVGEPMPATLSIVSSIAKPEMTVRLIITLPSGMSLSGAEFSEACAGQCVAVYKVGPGQLRNVGLTLQPNQAGEFTVEGNIEWFFGEDRETVFRKNVSLEVTVTDAETTRVQALPTATPTPTPTPTPAPTGGGGCFASAGGNGTVYAGWLLLPALVGLILVRNVITTMRRR